MNDYSGFQLVARNINDPSLASMKRKLESDLIKLLAQLAIVDDEIAARSSGAKET